MALYYKPGPITEGIRNIIQGLLQEYNIESAADIQEALKDLLGGTIKEMMDAEMDEHLGYEKSERSDSDDARNGYIAAAYPQTEYQRCIVHQVRNTLRRLSNFPRETYRARMSELNSLSRRWICLVSGKVPHTNRSRSG